jgi:hypothetical protein
MKKIINGKKYDTDTAEEVAYASYGHPSDFSHWRETLYRTKNGTFFLHGVGGPSSRWRERIEQNTYSGGCNIRLMTDEEARGWVERYDNAEYEPIFGEVCEG